jgi:hypothetical protein
MSISLFSSLLPPRNILEGEKIFRETTLPVGRPKTFQEQYRTSFSLAEMMLRVANEAAKAFEKFQYKPFDALIKNFGCQISALELCSLSKNKDLREEASRIQEITTTYLETIAKQNKLGKYCYGEEHMSLVDYLGERAHLDITISPEFSRLVRLRLLCIVNDNKVINGREAPYTNYNPLYTKISKKKIDSLQPLINTMVCGMQADESIKAAAFIQKEAEKIVTCSIERVKFLNRILGKEHEKQSNVVNPETDTPIVSVPLIYNVEAVMRVFEGILLVKNKLFLVGKPIPEVKPVNIFMKMPQEEIISEEMIEQLPIEEPLLVIEAYINDKTALVKRITEIGIITLLLAECAHLPQYAANTKDAKGERATIDDEEARMDIAKFQMVNGGEVWSVDHMFCSSIGEER